MTIGCSISYRNAASVIEQYPEPLSAIVKDPEKKLTDVPVTVTADLAEVRPHWEKGAGMLREFAVSPTGKRVAFEARGEIVTVPAEKGGTWAS